MQMTMYNTSSRRPPALPVAGASVAVAHRFRLRPAHDPVQQDLATHAGERPPWRSSSCSTRSPKDRTFFDDDPQAELDGAWARRQTTSPTRTAWDRTRRGVAARHLGDHPRLREGGRRRHLHDRHRRGERHGLEGLDGRERRPGCKATSRRCRDVQTRDELTKVLTSLLYRVTVHGAGSLDPVGQPGAVVRRRTSRRVSRAPPFPSRALKLSHAELLAAPAAHRHHRRDDDLLLHVRLLPAVRAADPERRHQRPTRTSRRRRPTATRRCSSTEQDIENFVDDVRPGRGTRRLRGSAGQPAGPLPSYAENQVRAVAS